MIKFRVVLCLCVVMLVGAVGVAQQPASRPEPPAQPGAKPAPPAPGLPAPAPPAGAAGQPEPPVAGQAYIYDPQGRRDPFVSLLTRGTDPRGTTSNRPAGLPGMMISEVAVKGIIKDRSGFIALIQAPNTKTFMVRPGEKLMDGTVKAITADSVVFAQDVNDPLSMVKQKEVRKMLRQNEGGRN